MERIDIQYGKNAPDLTRRGWLKTAAWLSAAVATRSRHGAWAETAQNETQPSGAIAMFQNPLFAGDHPDPTILRVGADFYMTHTSYAFMPGLVVWHSRDLVNWLPISHAADSVHGEIWAPDLVYVNERYFIYFAMNGIHVVHAQHPRGPWSAPIDLKVNDIDPGHVVGPAGKRYLYTAGGHVTELSPDGLSAIGKSQHVYKGWTFPSDWKTEGVWLESPSLTRRGDYYYLICAEGGTAGPPTSHMSIVARSTSPNGPWENSPHNPLVHTYSADEAWWSVGHGTLVSTPDNRWYFVYHGYRKDFQTLGRNTLMEPIEWTSDGWPVAPLGARRGDPMPAPMGVAQRPMIELSDAFRLPDLKLTWGAWNESDMTRYQPGGGVLTVRAKGNTYSESSPLTIRARHESYVVQVNASIDDDSAASLALEYYPKAALYLQLQRGRVIVQGPKEKLADLDWLQPNAWLKLINRRNRVEVLVSQDGEKWQTVVPDFEASVFDHNRQHGGFQAARPALSASGKGTVRFRDFRYQEMA